MSSERGISWDSIAPLPQNQCNYGAYICICIYNSLDKSTRQVTNLLRFRFLKSLRIHCMYREWWTLVNAGDHFKRTGIFCFPIGNIPLPPSQSLFPYRDIILNSLKCCTEPPLALLFKISRTLHARPCEQL